MESKPNFQIREDDLSSPTIIALLEEHLAHMKSISPPESVHALDLDGLRSPEVTFWSVWDGTSLLGCGALKELSPDAGEIKSMRTSQEHRGRGVGSHMVRFILAEAQKRGYIRLSLETGPEPEFEPARSLYRRFGFETCGPFADYVDDQHSVFMTKILDPTA
ncbi:MAG: GNAT family N-acetyltransferase [Candidatus Eisenbacteria bacterium]|uniref:GNAT family N-acetyltransferase n=1 Tax=Eiseniibacteriota bacterium TaxID=2212470 RepID=A0A7Y2E9A2_UNCEI|nr:GNAT family N-acetyltransferase [Candidatus Eisenbacteria bacterium]